MQSMQSLRARINSVKSTRKITKAMEMIANAKADLIFHFGIVANTIIDIRL